MNYLNPAERILFPVIISVRADTADVLREMANEMEVSMDEVLSAIAEESAYELGVEMEQEDLLERSVYIPDKCSTEDLLKLME